jgi:hypothetical protein
MMDRRRVLAWLLVLAGLGEFLAFACAVMPFSWMDEVHRWLDLGPLPHTPAVEYMARSLSLAYGLHALLLWLLASDVTRFRPVIAFHGYVFMALAPVFLALDFWAGLPWYWTFIDAWPCLFFGAAILWLNRDAAPKGLR